uniref:Uncharacterized protein n=1 Tax=Strongyloides venezuelensis TaxID=75913 RepID=A0A0K0EUE6_STRVS
MLLLFFFFIQSINFFLFIIKLLIYCYFIKQYFYASFANFLEFKIIDMSKTGGDFFAPGVLYNALLRDVCKKT